VNAGMGISPASAPLGISPMSASLSLTDTTFGDGGTSASDGASHVFTSSSGDDTFNLEQGYTDTLLYKMLDSTDATGGNGHDQVNGFTVGAWGTDTNADRIDLSDLLQGYQPATADTGNTVQLVDNPGVAHITADTTDTGTTVDSGNGQVQAKVEDASQFPADSIPPADSGATTSTNTGTAATDTGTTTDISGTTADASKPVDSATTTDTGSTANSGGLDQYLSVTHDNNNTTVNVDVNGTGNYAPLVTLNNVDVSLETLLANHQIVV